MRGKSKRTKELRAFILSHVKQHPKDIGAITAQRFGVSRQAISRHLNSLVKEGLLAASGTTRNRAFILYDLVDQVFHYDMSEDMAEDVVWRESVLPLVTDLKENVLDICQYGFTEMVNNVLSHSGSTSMMVGVCRNAFRTQINVYDEGIGVFQKIQNDFNLRGPRHALLELSKGKLTSDHTEHSGEGIFFASKMFDTFSILSGTLFFAKSVQANSWLIEIDEDKQFTKGTHIRMEISEDSQRDMKDVFDEYASEHSDWGFTKTHVALTLLRHEGEKLLSRSQAKRLLSRVDQFKEVVLDFNDITNIGQAFADEIFRVFKSQHPEVVIHCVNTTENIEKMVARVGT